MTKRESKLKFTADEMAGISGNTEQKSDDNAGVDSANAVVDVTDRGVRTVESAHRSYSRHRQTQNSSQHIRNRQSPRSQDGKFGSSKAQQKRAIKKDYAAAKSGKKMTKKSAAASKRAAKSAKETNRAVVFVVRHRKGIIVIALLAVMMLFMFGAVSSCSILFEGGAGAFGATTYPASDEDIYAAEALYTAKEEALRSKIDYYASNTNYDEYHYNIGEIGHEPHVLISAISALHPTGWDLESASGTIDAIFDMQYEFTEEIKTETRYRTETRTVYLVYTDPDTGEQTVFVYEYEEEVPYEYTICTVTIESVDLIDAAGNLMDYDEFTMFYNYMLTLGNRPDLFAEGT